MNFLFINVSLIFQTLLVIKPRITSKNYLLHKKKKIKINRKNARLIPNTEKSYLKGKKTNLPNEDYLLHLGAGN